MIVLVMLMWCVVCRERAHGVAQPARVLLQRGGGGRGRAWRRLRRRRHLRLRPLAPALLRVSPQRTAHSYTTPRQLETNSIKRDRNVS